MGLLFTKEETQEVKKLIKGLLFKKKINKVIINRKYGYDYAYNFEVY